MDMNEAEVALDEALKKVEQAARDYVEQYGTDAGSCLRIVATNKSKWSGGTASRNNIVEAIVRDTALGKLQRLIR